MNLIPLDHRFLTIHDMPTFSLLDHFLASFIYLDVKTQTNPISHSLFLTFFLQRPMVGQNSQHVGFQKLNYVERTRFRMMPIVKPGFKERLNTALDLY